MRRLRQDLDWLASENANLAAVAVYMLAVGHA